jgi:hypothetical protein
MQIFDLSGLLNAPRGGFFPHPPRASQKPPTQNNSCRVTVKYKFKICRIKLDIV